MKTLRLSTMSLTIILLTLGALILPANTALAHCKANHKKDPNCDEHIHDDPGDDSATYTAELTMGGAELTVGSFIFDAKNVTPNSRGTSFNGDGSSFPVTPGAGSDNEAAWRLVLADCADLLDVNEINYMTVPSFNANRKWNIGGDGIDIWMGFRIIDFDDFDEPGLDIGISLGGVVGTDPVVPECGSPSSFTLTRYSIHGQAKRGLSGPSCQNFDGHLQAYSFLKIERTDCTPP